MLRSRLCWSITRENCPPVLWDKFIPSTWGSSQRRGRSSGSTASVDGECICVRLFNGPPTTVRLIYGNCSAYLAAFLWLIGGITRVSARLAG